MWTWSTLRRSSQPFAPLHHRRHIIQSLRNLYFSALPPLPPATASHSLASSTASGPGPFLRLVVSGIIVTSSTIAALALYSSRSNNPANFPTTLSFADDGSLSVKSPSPSLSLSNPSYDSSHTDDDDDDDDGHPSQQPKFLFGDAYRRKVFFNYEKRIRMRSPPEKVFEYFASHCADNGETFMTPADLMRAVVPVFPPSESNLVRDGYLLGERTPGELHCAPSQFFMLFDTDNDGLISFKEYIFFVTLLSIPESSFSVAFKMFDLDCNREIDREEFKKVMALMRAHNRQGAFHRDGLRAGHSLGGSVENGGLVEYFFGEDGKKCLHHDKFVQFLRDLHDEMLKLEFSHYDYKCRGTISAKDFALSMVAAADLKHLSKLLDRVDDLDKMPQISSMRITLEEFKSFAELRKKLQPFSVALFSFGEMNGLLTKGDFKRAGSQVCDVSLSDNVIEVIFHVFDANGDGSLSWDEFIRVLQKREKDIGQPTEAGVFNFLACCWNCTNKDGSISRLLS